MNRLETKLASLRSRGERGLAPYLTAGDGGLGTTLSVLHALDEEGAACVELGLPFSDPIADGPVLQAAADRALAAGTTFQGVLDTVARFRETSALPVVLMTYANPLLVRGWDASLRAIARAGADGLIVADLPVEEGREMAAASISAGVAPIFFVSVTTSEERIAAAVRSSRGFVYAIGRLGVTGAETELDPRAQQFLERIHSAANGLSVAVGFGITSSTGVRAALRHADLAIVGSALVDRIQDSPADPSAAARLFLRELMKGLPPCIPP